MPHHIVQRGCRRQQVFFDDRDYRVYAKILAERTALHGVEIWAYCLMPNHVHLVAVPRRAESMSLAIGEAHQRYAVYINRKMEWKGHLWQDRYASFVMDEPYFITASRYVELNPVRAGLVEHPQDWLWSSANAHLSGTYDVLVRSSPLLDLVDDWSTYLTTPLMENQLDDLRSRSRTGNPAGSARFLYMVENHIGRSLQKQKLGPKPPNPIKYRKPEFPGYAANK